MEFVILDYVEKYDTKFLQKHIWVYPNAANFPKTPRGL